MLANLRADATALASGLTARWTVPDPMITPALLALVRRTYVRDAARRGEPYASPLLAPASPDSRRPWSSRPSATCCRPWPTTSGAL